jgi:hypothetical protein
VQLVFNQLLVQVSTDDRYEGFFNAANFHVFTVVIAVLVACGSSFYQYGGFAKKMWKYLPYFTVGILMLWITGSLEPQAGKLAWISMSYASVNALRIGWEANIYEGFGRSALVMNLGLVESSTVVREGAVPNDVEDEEDYRTAFIGVLFLLISVVLSGSISNGNYGMPFKGTLGSVGWTKGYQASVVSAFAAMALGFCATFLAWSSDAGANPAHPFYETVMGMASYSLIGAFTITSAVMLESRFVAEIALFITGFFLLQAPVKCWQLATFSEEPTIKAELAQYQYTDTSGDYTNSVVSAELDRYKSTTILNVLQAVFTIYSAMKFLGDASQNSDKYDAVGYRMVNEDGTANKPFKKNIMHYVFITLGTLLAVVGCALTWAGARESLKNIGADESYRMDAANWYILMCFIAQFCIVVQFFENSLPSLKPLWWVGAGIVATVQMGFSNIGTHDRQLWHIDYSFAGMNELRALLMHEDEFHTGRAVGVDESDYDQALAGALLFWIGFLLTWVFTMKFPLSGCGSTTNWNRNSGVYGFAKLKSTQTIFVMFGFILYIVGLCVLLSNNLASPNIHGARSAIVNASDPDATPPIVSVCTGNFFNVHAESTDACIWAVDQDIANDRFTMNTMTSWVPADRKYSNIFLFITVGFSSSVAMFAGWLHGDSRSIKYGLIFAGVMWLALEYAMTYDGTSVAYGEKYGDYRCTHLPEDESESDCEMYKAGMVVIFLAGLCNLVAGLIMLGILDHEVEGATIIAPSTPSRSIPGDAEAITQEELALAVSTPEKAMELARRIQEQGYLSVVAAEPAGPAAPSTMV